jgi:hypothetical protein
MRRCHCGRRARADCHEGRVGAATKFFLYTMIGSAFMLVSIMDTVFITSPPPKVTSYDVFLTTAGDVLIATGAPTRTPVPGEPGEFISHVELMVVGGFGEYAEATGTMTFDGRSHTGTVPPTTDLVYQGTVCGPNVKGGGN